MVFARAQFKTRKNAYFPLRIGNKAELRGAGEAVNIEVLNKTKLIDEVSCVVVRDVVTVDGSLKESTDDWLAVARNGNVWYCGEEVKDYEYFEGDAPQAPELISRDGSFKVGRDGDKAGLARLLCSRDCVVTRAFTPMDPGVIEIKYYARGIGQFLNVKPASGAVVQLVKCNYDRRCASLPNP